MHKQTIGIIGPGKLGIVLAQLSIKASYRVVIAGSDRNKYLQLTLSSLVPGATALSRRDLIAASNIVILAIPLSKYRELAPNELDGKLVIDAMNYWWEVDGNIDTIHSETESSSEQVQDYFKDARVVKALSHIGYHDLYDHSNQRNHDDRRAVAVASDDDTAQKIVANFIDDLGFDPVLIGDLSAGKILEPGHPAFGASLSKKELQFILQNKSTTH